MDDLNASVEWTLKQMGLWGRRVTSPACAYTAPGSDIAIPLLDDFPHTTGLVAWRALGTAGEHAALAHHVTDGSGAVMTKPYLSLARATLLGAGRALYVLAPDNPLEREVRTLQLLGAEAGNLRTLVEDAENATGQIDTSSARVEAEQFSKNCEAALQARGKPPRSAKPETDMLKEIAVWLTGGTEDALHNVLTLWRLGSGTAHARTWPWDQGFEDEPYDFQFAVMWSMPMTLMDAAWKLWCRRRGSDTDVAPRRP